MSEALLQSDSQPPTYSSTNPDSSPPMTSLISRTYPGQDNRPTSKREVLAWYSYCFASEVYAVVSLSTIPLYMSADDSDVYTRNT